MILQEAAVFGLLTFFETFLEVVAHVVEDPDESGLVLHLTVKLRLSMLVGIVDRERPACSIRHRPCGSTGRRGPGTATPNSSDPKRVLGLLGFFCRKFLSSWSIERPLAQPAGVSRPTLDVAGEQLACR